MGGPAVGYCAVPDGGAVGRATARRWVALGPLMWVALFAGCGGLEEVGKPKLQPLSKEVGLGEPAPAPSISIFENEQAQVAIQFSRPVFLEGDVYLTTDRGVSLPMTRASRREGLGGAGELVWDRRAIADAFRVTGWERGAADWSLTDGDAVGAAAEFQPVGVGALPRGVQARTLAPEPTPLEVAELLAARLNEWRAQEDAPPLELGSNPVAARHAQLSLEECSSSHWDIHGMKPYHRYALTGGVQYVEENWGGTTSFCATAEDAASAPYVSGDDMAEAIEDLLAAFRSSPRHAASLLDPYARYAHVGIAWDPRNLKVSVLLERHLVNDDPAGMFSLKPTGELVAWGSFRESARLSPGARLRIYYEDFPTRLARGQLARTSCYTVGSVLVAMVVSPDAAAGQMAEVLRPYCPDPAEVAEPSARLGPRSEAEGLALHRGAELQSGQEKNAVWVAPATIWEQEGRRFRVEADVSRGMIRTGRFCAARVCPGIYTVQLEAISPDGQTVIAAQQSRWLGGRPSAAAEKLYGSAP